MQLSLHLLILLVFACGLASCGGDSSSQPSGDPDNRGYVIIDDVPQSTGDPSVTLYGTMFKPPGYASDYCPYSSAEMTVTWTNEKTGESGTAGHGYRKECNFLGWCACIGRWGSGSIPLDYGENSITVRAELDSGIYGQNHQVVERLPARPENLSAEAVEEGIMLSWDSHAEATSYNLYWSRSANFPEDGTQLVENVTSPFLHSSLEDNVTHYYRLTALVSDLEGDRTDAEWATSGWIIEQLHSFTPLPETLGTALSIDPEDRPAISFAEGTTGNGLLTFSREADNWITEELGQGPWMATADIAVDAEGTVHLVTNTTALVYWRKPSGGNWTSQQLDDQLTCDLALTLDGQSRLHLAYFSGHGIRYASNASGVWQVEQVADGFSDIGCSGKSRISIAVPAAVHIAYRESIAQPPYARLQYASNATGVWVVETVDDSSAVKTLSLAVDSSRQPHIAWCDNLRQFKYAARNQGNGTWRLDFIKSAGLAAHPSLAIGTDDVSHIGFYDTVNGEYKYATNRNGSWTVFPVEKIGLSATFDFIDNALSLDSQGNLHASYFNLVDQTLNYVGKHAISPQD